MPISLVIEVGSEAYGWEHVENALLLKTFDCMGITQILHCLSAVHTALLSATLLYQRHVILCMQPLYT